MPLRFIFVQHLLDLTEKRSVKAGQPLGDVLMNRTLADPKLFGGRAHRRPILDYVKGQLTGPFLNIAFQPATLPYASSRWMYMRERGQL
ncbi:hypothetical protein SDC9_56552 [bioreactor metagenome]|uniref:Uncharacterized protein n=1 Tax=bioreactor metagenome TaxID=1076179 RepID=A0A644X7V0_9ZZZZ